MSEPTASSFITNQIGFAKWRLRRVEDRLDLAAPDDIEELDKIDDEEYYWTRYLEDMEGQLEYFQKKYPGGEG